jgi:hypothetical protein
MPLPSKLTISVIIPVRNGGVSFCRCLTSVTEALPSPSEIIVVADEIRMTLGVWLRNLEQRC